MEFIVGVANESGVMPIAMTAVKTAVNSVKVARVALFNDICQIKYSIRFELEDQSRYSMR